MTLLVSGVVPALHMIFPSSEQPIPFSQHLQQIGSVVLHTYPLTLAIALITLSRRQKWLTWGKWFFAAMVVVIFGAMGNKVGEVMGHGAIQPADILITTIIHCLEFPPMGSITWPVFTSSTGSEPLWLHCWLERMLARRPGVFLNTFPKTAQGP